MAGMRKGLKTALEMSSDAPIKELPGRLKGSPSGSAAW